MRISGFSSLFSVIAVFLYPLTNVLKNTAIAEKREENPEILTNLVRQRLARFFPQQEGSCPPFTYSLGNHERMLRSCIRELEKAVAVRHSLLERFSGKFRRCWQMILRFSGSAKCYPCQGLGTFRQGKRLLANWPRLRERCWIFSSETTTAFLSSS